MAEAIAAVSVVAWIAVVWPPTALRPYPLPLLALPVLLAFRLGARETALATTMLCVLAVTGTVEGFGPFEDSPLNTSLLFVDSKQVRLISFEGKALAASPALGGDLDHARALVEPDGVYVCGGTKKASHRLDSSTLRPRWSFINPQGEAPCPKLFSATQVALVDGHHSVILNRATGKVLLSELDFIPDTDHVVQDGNGFCFHRRNGSVCLDR